MALSFCSNWGSLGHQFNPDMSSCQQTQPALVAEDLLTFDCNSALADTCIDPLLQPNELFCGDNYTNLLPFHEIPSEYSVSLSQDVFPLDELGYSYQCPKRQKSYENHPFPNLIPGFFDGYVPNPGLVPEPLSEVLAPLPETAFACGHYESTMKKTNNENLSSQSIAARERRRKIAEKTQELGKRIPGGSKMNTAEMFQAAFKYVKYLQAQVAVLQLMGSIQETKEPLDAKLQLLASPIIQGKLYSEEMCLVPRELLQFLANNHDVQSKPLIFKDIEQLLRTNS